jgi:hypothetical protein
MAYKVYCNAAQRSTGGVLFCHIQTTSSDADSLGRNVLRLEIEKIRKEKLSQQEIEVARHHVIGERALRAEYLDRVAIDLALEELHYPLLQTASASWTKEVGSLTQEDVSSFLETYLVLK